MVAPVRWGRSRRRFLSLFDIVGLDEGTCGRRLRVRQPQGVGFSVKAKPDLYVLCYLSTVIEFVQVGLPEMPVLVSVIPPGLAW